MVADSSALNHPSSEETPPTWAIPRDPSRRPPSPDETTMELEADQLVALIQAGELCEMEPGTVLFEEGDASDSVYLLLSGILEFSQRDSQNAPWLSSGHGDFVGEMGLLENRPRSATARAVDAVRVLRFNHDSFMHLVTNSPALVWKLMRSFSGRLRQREHTYTDTLKVRNQELAEANARLAEANANLADMNQNLEALVDARTKQLAEANARLEDLAAHDQVTGLYNRRYLQDTLDHKANMIARAAYPFAIIMVDIDNFKHYNDRNGHLAGDGVLRKVAELLRGVIRGGDVIARYGGEEFCILLENAGLEDAVRVAEKLRLAISEHDFPKGSFQPLGRVSISLGVAGFPGTAHDVLTVLAAADKALYRAKESGRNRVVTAPPRESPPPGP